LEKKLKEDQERVAREQADADEEARKGEKADREFRIQDAKGFMEEAKKGYDIMMEDLELYQFEASLLNKDAVGPIIKTTD